MVSNLQRGIVATNSGRWGDNIFKAPEQELDVQYVSAWHRNCLNNCEKNSWTVPGEALCKLKCDLQASPSDSQKSASIDVSDTLRGIGDTFYALADSASVL